jgi:uncharacterized protein (TIGR03118 family)
METRCRIYVLTLVSLLAANAAFATISAGSAYVPTYFVSDQPGKALAVDPLLVNPWGMASLVTSPIWFANNGTSTSQLYGGDIAGSVFKKNALTVSVNTTLPTGITSNATSDFVITSGGGTGPARFIFSSINGNITAWRAGESAIIAASKPGHVYTGLAFGNATANYLYAADFANGTIDVFNTSFTLTTLTGTFVDPTMPATFHPFNVQNMGGVLYVAYAKVGVSGAPESAPGNGYVSKFNTDGTFIGRLISTGVLDTPWGIALAPAPFGIFGGTLLVGNVGNGNINAYNPTTGAYLGQLQNILGTPIVIDGLRALSFGNGVGGGDTSTLYFTAGPQNGLHGLLGRVKVTNSDTAPNAIIAAAGAFTANVGAATAHTVAMFWDANGFGTYTTTINWGDGASSPGSVIALGIGVDLVVGTHTYAAETAAAGVATTVMISDTDGGTHTALGNAVVVVRITPAGDIVGRGDFNGDGKSDVLLRDSAGNLGMWLMNGSVITTGAFVGSPGGTYTVAGVADFNGDGMADILLRDSTGTLGMWIMNGPVITSGALVGAPGGSYTVAGVDDFNGDHKADILLRDALGNLGMWIMNGPVITSGASVGSIGSSTVVGIGDFSGDARADILLRDAGGTLGIWFMNGSTVVAGASVGSPGSSDVVAIADFNADTRADILLRDALGNIGLWVMNSNVIVGGGFVGSPGGYTVAAAKDYSGDGKADILLRDPTGQLGMWIMNSSTITSGAFVGAPGATYVAY